MAVDTCTHSVEMPTVSGEAVISLAAPCSTWSVDPNVAIPTLADVPSVASVDGEKTPSAFTHVIGQEAPGPVVFELPWRQASVARELQTADRFAASSPALAAAECPAGLDALATSARNLLRKSVAVVRGHGEIGERVCNGVLPDIELARQEGEPGLTSCLTDMVREWGEGQRADVEDLRRQYLQLEDAVACLRASAGTTSSRFECSGPVQLAVLELSDALGRASRNVGNVVWILEVCSGFWIRAENLANQLVQAPTSKSDADRHFSEYRGFWESLGHHCKNYCKDAELASKHDGIKLF
eukprot:TRINITY_DN5039_c0_g1_i6.p1 TRINITY_DN5039_c0_g1~~TRINITY_DN5039_c0_g1_i6.p1  ORF type:complete len:298 (-),score=29.27 TRINITY_DN5039_c0_g1_i6:144-1037(-)